MPETAEEKAAREAAEEEARRKAEEDARASEDDEDELTIEEAKTKLAESQKRIKELNRESAERRKRLEAFEKAEEERKQSELNEVQKAEAKAKTAEEEKARLEAENKALKLRGAFTTKARVLKLEFVNEKAEEDAFKALDVESVGDDHAGMEEALKTLVKERPYYFGKADTTVLNNDAREKGKTNRATLTQEQIAAKKRTMSPL